VKSQPMPPFTVIGTTSCRTKIGSVCLHSKNCTRTFHFDAAIVTKIDLRQAIPQRLKMMDAGATESAPRNRLARGSVKAVVIGHPVCELPR